MVCWHINISVSCRFFQGHAYVILITKNEDEDEEESSRSKIMKIDLKCCAQSFLVPQRQVIFRVRGNGC